MTEGEFRFALEQVLEGCGNSVGAGKVRRGVSILTSQRDKLLEELKRQRDHNYNPFEPDNQCDNYKRLCAVIAEVEG